MPTPRPPAGGGPAGDDRPPGFGRTPSDFATRGDRALFYWDGHRPPRRFPGVPERIGGRESLGRVAGMPGPAERDQTTMTNRRTFLRSLACAAVALGVVIGPVLADELIGRITAVNVEEKTLKVTEKDSDKEIDVKVTDDTVFVTPKGDERKVDLEKLQKGVEKSKKGMRVEITHDKGVASKIKAVGKAKKADAN